jgi:RNA polymerase sigma-70 factor (ECF subfamily)
MTSRPSEPTATETTGSGDRADLREQLEQHLPGLRRFLHHRMGRVLAAREDSVDLVQSVCREVLQQLHDARLHHHGDAEFRQWLYNAAVFKLRDRIKYWDAARRRTTPVGGDQLDAEHPVLGVLCTPSQEVSLQENLRRLQQALDGLPPQQRQIIVWAHIDNLSHRDIAERLHVTESHSRVLLARALARLARMRDSD